MTKILAIDASTDACSAALLVDNEVNERFMVIPKQHTNFILPMVDELLAEAKLSFKQLDAIAFGSGPGSFTGVRLAVSIAQGFAFAANLPVIGVSTLRALAQEVFVEFNHPRVLVVQDARMQEVYFGEYLVDAIGIMRAVRPDSLVKPGEMPEICGENLVGVGSGFDVYVDVLAKIDNPNFKIIDKRYVQAKYIVQLAADDFAKGLAITAEEALPIYLREKVVSV